MPNVNSSINDIGSHITLGINENLQINYDIDDEIHRFEHEGVSQHYLGKMDIACTHCKALYFLNAKVSNRGTSFNDCCSHGAAILQDIPEFPMVFKSLFQDTNPLSANFFSNIRAYNNSLAFASFNANLESFPNRPGPHCFKIQGQIYYQINTTLLAEENANLEYGQLFIVDQDEALEARLERNKQLSLQLLKILDDIMRQHNIFAQSYMMMGEELISQQREQNTTDLSQYSLVFTSQPGLDMRRYNSPRANEVAAIFRTTADGEIPDCSVVIRHRETKVLKKLSSMDPKVEPWIYPLFYPEGTRGWYSELRRSDNNRRITRSAYAKYFLGVRGGIFNAFIHGRRLFQQWLGDTYVKLERDRLQWCYQNQKKLRVDTYQGLQDYLATSAAERSLSVGKIVILPSTFIGSPRYMIQNYQDCMSIVRDTGKPDLFITMTLNPNCPEITENLLPGQQPSDRPDLIA